MTTDRDELARIINDYSTVTGRLRVADRAEGDPAIVQRALVDVTNSLGNGSFASPDSSAAFLANVPEEVASVLAGLRKERDEARAALAELVACKDNRAKLLASTDPKEILSLDADYNRRSGPAWAAARAAARAALPEKP